ncbi:putative transporter [Cyphellophora attinorum]|uniref:Putative transporter n=1 Tax=Cyphellophora attinorum TaxID=1664694 RepID=A0A0N0NKD7_9EURO|nr:putative transporter [Phialophora attinorum]KPI37719.1 putative transporter [Phialophora attinorum]
MTVEQGSQYDADVKSGTSEIEVGDQQHGQLDYSDKEEKQAVWKLDIVLIPLLSAIYLFSYIDRGNIGNAKTAGMTKELRISSSEYGWLISIYYIAYICFHWTILVWKVVDPPTWVAIMALGFGGLSMIQGAANNWSGLMALRFLIGVFEAGYGPGVAFFLSWFYSRSEMALRYGLFIGASALANAIASSLAYGIVQANAAISDWRLLFIVEGTPTLVIAVIAYFLIPRGPASVRFLSRRHNAIVADRAIKARGEIANEGKVSITEALKVFLDYKCWMQACIIFCFNSSFGSLPAFLPTIIKEMGFTSIRAQGLSAPPYLAAYVLCISLSFLSDRLKSRGLLIGIFAYIGAAGYLMLRLSETTATRYGAVYLVTCGVFPCIGLTFSWVTDNQMSSNRRGAGLALFGMIGQCGSFLGANIFPDETAPFFHYGMSIITGVLFAGGTLALLLSAALRFENRRKTRNGEIDPNKLFVP